jgi:hypothetical protein
MTISAATGMYRIYFLGDATTKRHRRVGRKGYATMAEAYRAKEAIARKAGVDGWWYTIEYSIA